MPLASDRQVNEKPFKIGTNSQKSARFDPLSWEKTAKKVASQLPKLRPYQYARLPNEILIVNPTDKKVADVVNRHA